MVATRGTDQTVAFITGDAKIDPSTIKVEQWVEILRSAINEIPMNYLHGLRSVKQILWHGEMEYNGYTAGVRRVPESMSVTVKPLGGSAKLLRASDVFLHCAEVGNFPDGRYPADRWKTAQRTAVGGVIAAHHMVNYLLSRDKKLYYMLTEWAPHERWDNGDLPADFWYEAQVVMFEELDDKRLDAYLANGRERDVAKRILHSLHSALQRTASDIRGKYDHMRAKQHVIGGYLARFGECLS